MECSLFEFSLMDWSNVTAVEELFTDSSPPSTLERVPVDGGDFRELPSNYRDAHAWPERYHTEEIRDEETPAGTPRGNSGNNNLVNPYGWIPKDGDERHDCLERGLFFLSNSGIEDQQPVSRGVFEWKFDQLLNPFRNSNRETKARNGTEYRPALGKAPACRICLTKPSSGYGIRDFGILRTNVKRPEDPEKEEGGECKQEYRYVTKCLTSKDVSFERECEVFKRLRKISGIATAKLFALYPYAYQRPLAWHDPCDIFAKIEVNRDEVAQWGLGLKKYRPSLNDSQNLHHLSWIDKICLVLNQTVFPLLVWILLLSLRLESPSLLDQKFQRFIPHTGCAITVLQRHHTTSLIIVLCLSGLRVLTLLKTPATMSERNRSFTYPCCTLSLMAGSLIWIKIGGSVLGFFLVLMPYALSVGVSVGVILSLRGLSGRESSTEPPLVPMFRRLDEEKS